MSFAKVVQKGVQVVKWVGEDYQGGGANSETGIVEPTHLAAWACFWTALKKWV